MVTQLEQLLMVSQAKYDHQQQAFAKILMEETRLRQEIVRLDKLNENSAVSGADLVGMQAIGADILWQGWLSRSKTTLNMDLARVLAIKTHEQAKVRQAFGKVVALQELIRTKEKAQTKKSAQTALSLAIDQSLT